MNLDSDEIRVFVKDFEKWWELVNIDSDEIRAFVNDFENCGVHDACELCKCYDKLNGTQCTICELLLTYRNDLADRICELLDKM